VKLTTKQEKIEIAIGEDATLRTLKVSDLAAPAHCEVQMSAMKYERLSLWIGNEFAEFTDQEWDRFVRRVAALRDRAKRDPDPPIRIRLSAPSSK
jgi:hypothetical protein